MATLTNGVVAPAAVWVDAKGTLYVANDFGPNDPFKDTITEFRPGSTLPVKVLTGIYMPGALAVDSKGTVFVEDQDARVIDVYENGSTVPTRKITGVGSAANALTVDEAGNLYAVRAGGERCRSDVVKIPPGANGGRSLGFKVAGCAYGIALDAVGSLYVAYFGDNNVSAVNVYHPGARVPFRRILQGVNAPFRLAFDRDGSLYVPNDNSTTVTVYPKGNGTPSITISSGIQNPFGVAISPAAPLAP
jgi:sugar lactone lactonase YvrE